MSKYTALAQDEGHSLDHEKSLIAYHQTIRHHRRAKSFTISAILTTLSGLLAIVYILRFGYTGCNAPTSASWPLELQDLPACPQYPALEPPSDKRAKFEKKINDAINSEAFFNKSVARMQGALWIPTESFDDMGKVGEDERWEIFGELHAYFEKTFPLVYSRLDVTTVNSYGLVIEWKGSNSSLKPYLFMGHQDVVPVPAATAERWTYPPYSAHFDGRFIWGRGSTDCKNVVIGILEAWETLLEFGYEPKRTMLASFGFDEEISGWHGAAEISKYLEKTLGKDSIELILDEGGLGVQDLYGGMFVLPGLGEKGYFDVRITVETDGGHSSVPPDHTGIGILSDVITAIEAEPYSPLLTPRNPFFTTLQCSALHGPEMDPVLRSLILAAQKSPAAAASVAKRLSESSIASRYLMQTSQAVDLISGGVKINALPEKVSAVVNHRIAVESLTSDVRSRLISVLTSKIISKYPLALDAWGSISGNTSSSSAGTIRLSDFNEPLEPSPISPYDSNSYKIFSGTSKSVFGEDVIVAPSLMTGNTDTKFYWNLSRNIYRFSPVREGGRVGAHTVDERMGMKEHVEGVRFYTTLVLNGDR